MINDIISKLPIIIADFFDEIIITNKDNDEFYLLNYDGKKVSLKIRENYSSLNNYLNDSEISLIEKEKIIIDKEKVIHVYHQNGYTLIFISKCKKDIVNSNKKEKLGTLLIADDSPVITNFFKKIFIDRYNVLVAKDGNMAISLIEENKDELLGVFLDLAMPVSSGFDVLDYFKENDLFKSIPVSIISGDESKEGIERATSYQVIDMLQKPFNAASAEAIVNKTIGFSPKNK